MLAVCIGGFMVRKNYSSFNRRKLQIFERSKKTMFDVYIEELTRTVEELEILMDYPTNLAASEVVKKKKEYCRELLRELEEVIREI